MNIEKAKDRLERVIAKTPCEYGHVHADIDGELWYSDRYCAVRRKVNDSRTLKMILPTDTVCADLILDWEFLEYKKRHLKKYVPVFTSDSTHFVNKKYIRPFTKNNKLCIGVTITAAYTSSSYAMLMVKYDGVLEAIMMTSDENPIITLRRSN